MKIKFTDLLNNYQDDTIDFKCKNIVDSKEILKRAGVTRKHHITMTKRSLSILLASAVLMMSGITVYAVESGALNRFIKDSIEYRDTPYSYDKTYNEVIDYDTFFAENINTDIKAENVACSNPDVNIEIEGVLCDINSVQIIADLNIPNANLITNNDIKHWKVWFGNYSIESKCDNSIVEESLYVTLLEDDDSTDNIVPVRIAFLTDYMQSADGEYSIQISDLTKHEFIENHSVNGDGTNIYTSIAEFELSFDINLKDCDVSTKIDNVNKIISTPIGDVEIDSINYSPMSFCINFKEPLPTNLGEYVSDYNGNRYGYTYSLNKGYTSNEFNKVENYINMYFIYSDGRKVFANRDTKQLIFTDDLSISNVIFDYYHSSVDMVDYTNIVAIQVNDVVIPLK